MTLGISTHWNAYRHKSGESMIDEILDTGFQHVELGYDLTVDLIAGVEKKIAEKAITVESVHNFCPVPMGAPYGHPELFSLSSPDPMMRKSAVFNTIKTIEFAASVGAKCMVVHSGNVDMKNITRKLITLAEKGKQYSPTYEKLKIKLLDTRNRKAGKYIDSLYKSLEDLIPILESFNIKMGLENLPSWESIPTENEMEEILKKFDVPQLGCWHDMGHGQTRQNLGFISHIHWAKKFKDHILGMHVHDIQAPAYDHLAPSKGNLDFVLFKNVIKPDTVLILEPAPGTTPEDVKEGSKVIRDAWEV